MSVPLFQTTCKKCDYSATFSMTYLKKICPCCQSKLEVSLYKNQEKLSDILLEVCYKPNNDPFTLEIDGAVLVFQEIASEDEEAAIIASTFNVKKKTKMGIPYEEQIVDEFSINVSILAKALVVEEWSYPKKVEFLRSNFSKKQLDLLYMMYDSYIRDKYDEIVQEEISKYLDSSENEMLKTEDLLDEEIEIIEEELKNRKEKKKKEGTN